MCATGLFRLRLPPRVVGSGVWSIAGSAWLNRRVWPPGVSVDNVAANYQTSFVLRLAFGSVPMLAGLIAVELSGASWPVLIGVPFAAFAFARAAPTTSTLGVTSSGSTPATQPDGSYKRSSGRPVRDSRGPGAPSAIPGAATGSHPRWLRSARRGGTGSTLIRARASTRPLGAARRPCCSGPRAIQVWW
jgi:hypothetical protein